MSEKYKVGEDINPHFVSFTVVGWIDVFSREIYKEILVESLKYCVENKGLTLHAWVIMTNHVHLIVSSENNHIGGILGDLKKYTSRKITDLMVDNSEESRKEWILNMFKFVGRQRKEGSIHQFWQYGSHPIELSSDKMIEQRLNYLHENPVRAGLVWEPWHYKYSSAIDYYTEEKGFWISKCYNRKILILAPDSVWCYVLNRT